MIRLKAPDTVQDGDTVGIDGVEYAVEDGHVEVPEPAEMILLAHGYRKSEQPARRPHDRKKR
jgi:hypothetical protein